MQLQKRNHKLKDDVQSAAELLKSVEEKLAEYEKLLTHARHEALLAYEKALSEIRNQEDAAIQTVKEEIKKSFLMATSALQDEKLKVESELKLQVNQLSDSITQKILTGK